MAKIMILKQYDESWFEAYNELTQNLSHALRSTSMCFWLLNSVGKFPIILSQSLCLRDGEMNFDRLTAIT